MPAADLSLNGNETMVVGIGYLLGRQDTANGPKLRTVLDSQGPSVTLELWEGNRQEGEAERLLDLVVLDPWREEGL
jgi:hypothetical protein